MLTVVFAVYTSQTDYIPRMNYLQSLNYTCLCSKIRQRYIDNVISADCFSCDHNYFYRSYFLGMKISDV